MIAATGVWFGRWVDAAIQRITEVNAILPVLPILIMIGIFYSRSLWVMLGAIILLSIFSLGIKTYRSILLQVKESPYIEAARTYGTGNFRIIFRYMIPRIIPVLIPQFVTLIPSFVFLEAGLAVLGLSAWIGPKIATPAKDSPFECGVPPVGDSRQRISVRFYLVGILFLLFDVEAVFLYPWAVAYKKYLTINEFILLEMGAFVGILLIGYFYVLFKGALKWD